MNRIALVCGLLAAFAACDKKAAAPDCAAAVTAGVDRAAAGVSQPADSPLQKEMADAQRAVVAAQKEAMTRLCVDDHWSDKMRTCLTSHEIGICASTRLTKEQRTRYRAADDALVQGRAAGH